MSGATTRLDKWLWYARFCKTRSLAASLVASGGVRVNSVRVTKPSTAVRVGDGLSFGQGSTVHALRVEALGVRRGPAVEARGLYKVLGEPPDAARVGLEHARQTDK